MIELFDNPYRPQNYSLQEVSEYLEGNIKQQRQINYILKNWNKMSSPQMAKHLGISLRTVFKLTKGLIGKKKRVQSVITIRPGLTLLNIETGIYYECLPEAAKSVNVPKTTFRDFVNGKRKNNLFEQFRIV